MTNQMKRLVCGLVLMTLVASGCSWTQVQTWFQVRGASVTEQQAREIAVEVNKSEPANCDPNYSGVCIPTNVTAAYCAGQPADGFAVTAPVKVTGWDHFKLGAGADGMACTGISPQGNLDSVIDTLDREIRVSGWAFDRDTDAPIQVHIYVNGVGHVATADQARPDLASAGLRTNSGFTAVIPSATGTYDVCAFAINVGSGANTGIGCARIAVGGPIVLTPIINAERIARGQNPVMNCDLLTAGAIDHVNDMAFTGVVSPNVEGEPWAPVISYYYGTEVKLQGLISNRDALGYLRDLQTWVPAFYDHLMSGSYTHIGIAAVQTPEGNRYWSVVTGSNGDCY